MQSSWRAVLRSSSRPYSTLSMWSVARTAAVSVAIVALLCSTVPRYADAQPSGVARGLVIDNIASIPTREGVVLHTSALRLVEALSPRGVQVLDGSTAWSTLDFVRQIRQLVEGLHSGDEAIVYFSGGAFVDSGDVRLLAPGLLPISDRREVWERSISLREVRRAMRGDRGVRLLILVDAWDPQVLFGRKFPWPLSISGKVEWDEEEGALVFLSQASILVPRSRDSTSALVASVLSVVERTSAPNAAPPKVTLSSTEASARSLGVAPPRHLGGGDGNVLLRPRGVFDCDTQESAAAIGGPTCVYGEERGRYRYSVQHTTTSKGRSPIRVRAGQRPIEGSTIDSASAKLTMVRSLGDYPYTNVSSNPREPNFLPSEKRFARWLRLQVSFDSLTRLTSGPEPWRPDRRVETCRTLDILVSPEGRPLVDETCKPQTDEMTNILGWGRYLLPVVRHRLEVGARWSDTLDMTAGKNPATAESQATVTGRRAERGQEVFDVEEVGTYRYPGRKEQASYRRWIVMTASGHIVRWRRETLLRYAWTYNGVLVDTSILTKDSVEWVAR